MIAYHGSNSNFKKLRISKSLVKRGSTLVNEGLGIYFSTNRDVAESYGQYIYVLEINDRYVLDFRDRGTCINYMQGLVEGCFEVAGIDISQYFNVAEVVNRMQFGGLSIAGLGREIALCLDNNYEWYTGVSATRRTGVEGYLRGYDKKHLVAYMFRYHIENCGVLKSVDDNVVRIVEKISR